MALHEGRISNYRVTQQTARNSTVPGRQNVRSLIMRHEAAYERALELLADRATVGLDETETAELQSLLSQYPALDDDTFDLAAAAIALVPAGLQDAEPLPEFLRARLLQEGEELVRSSQAPSGFEALGSKTKRHDAAYERALELLADRATVGLDESEAAELSDLLRQFPALDDDTFDLAAAAIALVPASREDHEPLPEFLQARLLREGKELVRSSQATRGFEALDTPVVDLTSWKGMRRNFTASRIALLTAAVLFVALGWFYRSANTPIQTECLLSQVPAVMASTERDQLLTEPDAVAAAWQPTQLASMETVRGDIVWSSARQEGIVVLEGLRAEDLPPVLHLWIVDGQRRIDGGTFDLDPTGDVMMAVALKNAEGVRPLRFELTVEDPEVDSPQAAEPILVASLEGTSTSGFDPA